MNVLSLLRIKIWKGENRILDTGRLRDTTMRGGKLGFYTFSLENIIFSDITVRCLGEYLIPMMILDKYDGDYEDDTLSARGWWRC